MFRLVNFNPMFPIGTPVPKVIDANIKKLKAPFQVQYIGTKPKTFKKRSGYNAATKQIEYTDVEDKQSDSTCHNDIG
jgi:hypothetical protein